MYVGLARVTTCGQVTAMHQRGGAHFAYRTTHMMWTGIHMGLETGDSH